MVAAEAHTGPIARVLAAHHSTISERDIAEILNKALEQARTDAPLSAGEEAFYRAHAGVELANPDEVRLRRGLQTLLQSHADAQTALSTSEAARLCGISESRMRHRIAAGEVYVLPGTSGRGHRLPRWQFTSGGPLPHLREVLEVLPAQMPAAVLEAFMTEPADDLQLRGEPVSIIAWLAAGGGTEPVLQLAASENTSR